MRPCCRFLSLLLLLLLSASAWDRAQEPASSAANTFHNPLLETGPDPWVIAYKGDYFFMSTTGRNLTVWKTRDITDLAHAEKKVVWTPPADGPYSKEIWAPELHRLDGKWYIYFAADAGRNDSHRIYVVENSADDPLEGAWTFKGKIGDATDKWAIDASVFEDGGQRYMVWSGWEGDADGEQRIYLAHMKNPWTIDSKRVELSHPQYPWEEVGDLLNRPAMPHLNVNEGPEILKHAGDIFLVYSASACWTDYYALGLVRAKSGANLMDPASWKKYDHAFFKQNRTGGVFGPGHNGFFKSPDGKQDWIIYHANAQTGQGCGKFRSPRIQPFTWNADGTPDFGEPVPAGTAMQKPSGQ
ncbi:MAG: glycoside hydrolase family 43 protein [Acidobacteria bacterium]|nr:glycoside hydrolase family 43 protein [Acidobacteriota bacterium]